MNDLEQTIISEINAQGAITFARFMELALYCPELGYYEREADNVGRKGDFYTSVSVGPLFGWLLASEFARSRGGIDQKTPWTIVEAGAHDGRLALDIMVWLQKHSPELFRSLAYVIIEPSARRRSWQQARLGHFRSQLCWVRSPQELSPVDGVIFANEFLDAFPVHRVSWDAGRARWIEWGVNYSGGRFHWILLQDDSWSQARIPIEVPVLLPNGFTTESCPAAVTWWKQVAGKLERGWLLTLDYGLTTAELFSPQRSQGTLRAFRSHRPENDVLDKPGEQDITTHVNFSAVAAAGEACGLRTEPLETQAVFLTDVARHYWARFGEDSWSPKDTRQFQTLTHPDHLGRAFRVLKQTRTGLAP